MTRFGLVLGVLALAVGVLGCGEGGDGDHHHDADGDSDADGDRDLEQTLFVGHEGVFASYDVETGDAKPGEIPDVTGPTDLQSLEDGTLMVNLTGRNEVMLVDAYTMLEVFRLPSSTQGATRPVHSFITPEVGGRQFWVSMNDGDGTVATNSAQFIDVGVESDTAFDVVGEVGLGIGHHKACFSATSPLMVASNIGDCDNVLTVYNYSDPANITAVETLTAEEAGWDGTTFPTTCDPTYENGLPPAPHGCATSPSSGRGYCNLTSSGEIVAVDFEAQPPTFTRIATAGAGGGYTRAHTAGRYVYSAQGEPREGGDGALCQIGQLAVIDSEDDSLAAEVPLFYEGPTCTRALVGTDEETAEPGHLVFTHDGDTLYVSLAGGFGVETARVRQEIAFDVSDPAVPVQLDSIPTGASTGHHGDALSGDGRFFFVTNTEDDTVTQISTETNEVVRTIEVGDKPLVLTTFGTDEGPAEQTGPVN